MATTNIVAKQRILYLDLTKAFAIFCVLLGHVIQLSSSNDPYHDSWLFQFIYAYHMPLFVMVSGFFLGKSLQQPFKVFLQKRITQLILPIITFGSLFFVFHNTIYTALSGHAPITFNTCFFGANMWFLRYLFAMLGIAYISKRLFRNTLIAALLPMVILFCFTKSGIFRLYPYLWCGYFFATHSEKLLQHCKRNFAISTLIFAAGLCFWQGDYDANLRFIFLKPHFYLDTEHLGYVLIRLWVGLSGSFTFLFLFKLLSDQLPQNKLSTYVQRVGRHTLGIYCVQIYLLEFALDHFKVQFSQYDNTVFHIAFAMLLLIVFNAIVVGLEKNKWTALCFLGKK